MTPENITITITKSSAEEGYFYDIYLADTAEIEAGAESEDGGHCTSENPKDVLEMATAQAIELLARLSSKKD